MTHFNIQYWINHPESLNKDTLYELRMQLIRYPYCQSLRLLYLKNLFLLHDSTFSSELRKSSFYITDRTILYYLLEGVTSYSLDYLQDDKEVFESSSLDRTSLLIDAFLSKVPDDVMISSELNYSTDYTSFLEDHDDINEDDIPQLNGIELIDGFIERNENSQKDYLSIDDIDYSNHYVDDEGIDKSDAVIYRLDDDDECFTETLAKIYVKQQRYDKALEIIKKLSLKYPKKNVYFADQIRFLEKLIINTKSK